jgi:hypothetical protein
MLYRSQIRLCVLAASFGLVFCSLAGGAEQKSSNRGRKYKAPPPTARIEVTIVRDDDGKPIENAAVIFRPIEGERTKGNMELKTNEDGKTIIDVLPIGDTVRLQIIAKGYQTYGGDFKVDKAEMAREIRMKRPGAQYSIYKDHPEANGAGKSPDANKPATPPAGTAKDEGKSSESSSAPASKDKPAAQPDAQQPPK